MMYDVEVSDRSRMMPSSDELVLLERAFGTSFARALTWCTEIPGYTPTSDDDADDDADDDEHPTTEYLTETEFFDHLKTYLLGE